MVHRYLSIHNLPFPFLTTLIVGLEFQIYIKHLPKEEGRSPKPPPYGVIKGVNHVTVSIQAGDEQLIARVSQRDKRAFGLLYDRYAQPVYAMAVHLLGSADAEEIVQEVFLRLWNRAHQFDPSRGSFKAWFMTLARHQILDALRKRGQQQRLIAVTDVQQLLETAENPQVGVEQQVWRQEDSQQLLAALKALPPEQRQALLLAYFGGLSQSAIAKQLGWPLGTVKKRIRLGMQKLRVALAPQKVLVELRDETTDAE